jgi:hypothetical protein
VVLRLFRHTSRVAVEATYVASRRADAECEAPTPHSWTLEVLMKLRIVYFKVGLALAGLAALIAATGAPSKFH